MAVEVKVGLIGALDMLKFKNMAKVREKAIKAAPALEITADYAINNKAKAVLWSVKLAEQSFLLQKNY